MATYEEFMQAALRADQEGNEDDARTLVQLALQAKAPPAQTLQKPGAEAESKPLPKAAFINRSIAQVLGAPVDLTDLAVGRALQEARAFGQTFGQPGFGPSIREKLAEPTKPFHGRSLGGSASIEAGLRSMGMPVADRDPETLGERIAAGIGEVASFAIPAGAVTRVISKGKGITGRLAKQIDDFLVQKPVVSAASDIAAGVGVGVGRHATADSESELAKVAAETAGGLIGGGLPLIASSSNTLLRNIGRELQVQFTPSRKVGQEVVEAIHQATGKVEAAKFEGATIRARINRAIEATPEPEQVRSGLSRYLSGESNSIPRPLLDYKDDIIQSRKSITRFQKEMLENHYAGKRVLPDELVEQFENAGMQQGWLRRSYQFFSDPNYTPTSEQRAAAIRELTSEPRVFGDKTVAPLTRGQAEELLSEWNQARNTQDGIFRTYSAGTHAGILSPRKNLGPAVRSYLGEITSPGERMEASLTSIAKLAAYDTADREIAGILGRLGITHRPEQGLDGYVPLTLRRGPVGQGADSLHVPSDVQRSLNKLYASQAQEFGEKSVSSYLEDFVKSGISAKKATLVPANIVTYATNAITNTAQVLGQGINPFAGGKMAGVVGLSTFETVASNLKTQGRNYVKRMTELGLANPGFTTADILAGLNKTRPIGRAVATVVEPVGRAYSVTDTALRISVYESTKAQMMKEFPALTKSAPGIDLVERAAAQQTNATYQQYSHINQGLRELSTWGVLGQFVSFNLEMMRNQYNQVRLIQAKLNGQYAQEMARRFNVPVKSINQAEITKDAIRRATSLAAVYGAGIGGVAAYNYGPGGVKDEREMRALQETVLPSYLRNKTTVVSRRGDNDLLFKNAEYVVPHLTLTSPLMSALAGESFEQGVRAFGETLATDLGGQLPLFFRDLAQAYMDPRLTQETTMLGRTADRLSFLMEKTIKPQTIRELEKTFGPDPKQTIGTLGKRLSGLRVAETTLEEGAVSNLRAVSSNLRENRIKANQAVDRNQPNKVPDLQRIHDDNFQVLRRHVENLRVLGFDEDRIIRVMRESGISGRDALAAIDGRNADVRPPTRRTSANVWDEMGADNLLGMGKAPSQKGLAEVRRRISEEADPEVRDGLRRRLDRELDMRRKGISERDKVVRGLGVENGERAEYIFQQMQQMRDPNAYLNSLRRKGVVTTTVSRQIEQLRRAEQGR